MYQVDQMCFEKPLLFSTRPTEQKNTNKGKGKHRAFPDTRAKLLRLSQAIKLEGRVPRPGLLGTRHMVTATARVSTLGRARQKGTISCKHPRANIVPTMTLNINTFYLLIQNKSVLKSTDRLTLVSS